jgi:hypothetical protein
MRVLSHDVDRMRSANTLVSVGLPVRDGVATSSAPRALPLRRHIIERLSRGVLITMSSISLARAGCLYEAKHYVNVAEAS